jgi:hypothetical protein
MTMAVGGSGRSLRIGRTLLGMKSSVSMRDNVYVCRERRASSAWEKDELARLLVEDSDSRSTASSVHCQTYIS